MIPTRHGARSVLPHRPVVDEGASASLAREQITHRRARNGIRHRLPAGRGATSARFIGCARDSTERDYALGQWESPDDATARVDRRNADGGWALLPVRSANPKQPAGTDRPVGRISNPSGVGGRSVQNNISPVPDPLLRNCWSAPADGLEIRPTSLRTGLEIRPTSLRTGLSSSKQPRVEGTIPRRNQTSATTGCRLWGKINPCVTNAVGFVCMASISSNVFVEILHPEDIHAVALNLGWHVCTTHHHSPALYSSNWPTCRCYPLRMLCKSCK